MRNLALLKPLKQKLTSCNRDTRIENQSFFVFLLEFFLNKTARYNLIFYFDVVYVSTALHLTACTALEFKVYN